MVEIPLEQPKEADIFSFWFDKNLNRIIEEGRNPLVYDSLQDVLQSTVLSGTRQNIQLFTANGTWMKPEWSTTVDVWVISGGAGGGSGRRGAAGTGRSGGGGGAG